MSPTTGHVIRLLVVDDHQVVRAGLKALLSRYPQVAIVGEASNMAECLKEIPRVKPDLVLMDVRMPGGSGFDAFKEIRRQNWDTRVLFLTSFSDDEVLRQVLEVGADGFLLKDTDADELVRAIERVCAGESVLDPSVTRRILDQLKAPPETARQSKMDLLSAQEKRVLSLVTLGKTNKEIGIELGLSDKTVKNYLSNAMEKLQMSRRSQVAVFYSQSENKS